MLKKIAAAFTGLAAITILILKNIVFRQKIKIEKLEAFNEAEKKNTNISTQAAKQAGDYLTKERNIEKEMQGAKDDYKKYIEDWNNKN